MQILKYVFILLVIQLHAQPVPRFGGDTLSRNEQIIALPGIAKRSLFDGSALLITSDSAYKKQFADSVHLLPGIDFSRYELIGRTQCMRCATLCPDNPGCHRDACRYSRYWIKADKSSRTEITPLRREGCSISTMQESLLVITGDSMVQQYGITGAAVDFTKSVLLTTAVFADCKAHFRHAFFLDADRQCLVWRMFEQDGGCAGMDTHRFFFETDRLPKNYRVVCEIYREPAAQR